MFLVVEKLPGYYNFPVIQRIILMSYGMGLHDTFSKAFSLTTNFSEAKFSKTIFTNDKFF